jgi:ABC-type multidrug transport system ATPase subunit
MLAFINEPNLLLLDEPTAELDNHWTAKAIKFINDYLKQHHAALCLFTNDDGELKLFHTNKKYIINHS